jgi:hypothetical protein
MGEYPADGQGPHRRPVRGPAGGAGGPAAAAESLDRGRGGRAEASDARLLLGQLGQERDRITVAVPLRQVTGGQQGQGRVIGDRAAWPSLAGGQLLDLAGTGGIRGGRVLPRHAERVAAGVRGQGAVDAPSQVEDVLRV